MEETHQHLNGFLKGFEQHGVAFIVKNATQAHGNCPFCGKPKFYTDPETGTWDCKVCLMSGGFETFLSERLKAYRALLKSDASIELSKNRGLRPQTLKAWGVGWDPASKTYMIPMDGNPERKVKNLHRYTIGGKALSTSSGKLQLMVPLEIVKSQRVWLTEGEWDGMALWEALSGSEAVYASPGAGVFPKNQAAMFSDLDVVIVFDNDDAGQKGAARAGGLLQGYARSIRYLIWPVDLNLPNGFDIRDLYVNSDKDAKRVLDFIEANLSTQSPSEAKINPAAPLVSLHPAVAPLVIEGAMNHHEALEKYREWMQLTNPEILDVMFGSVFANRISVDPLWMFLVAPPGGSKTEMLMSLSDAQAIVTTSTFTPASLISGMNHNGGDPSLIPLLNGKVLIIKDFTVVLNLNPIAREEIFGILRDAYDGKIEKKFANGITRRYNSKFGIIAGVTPIIEGLSSSHGILGERFIRYKIRQPGRINVGSDIIRRALANVANEIAMRQNLKAVAASVLSKTVDTERVPKVEGTGEVADRLLALAQWVAALRGSVSRDRFTGTLHFKPVQEIGTRLAKQFCALALGISIYKNNDHISPDTMKTVVQVGIDTVPDRIEEIVRQMYVRGPSEKSSFAAKDIGSMTRLQNISYVLQDLDALGIIRPTGERTKTWGLTPTIIRLIQKIGMYDGERKRSKEIKHALQPS